MNVNLPNWVKLGKDCKACGLPRPEIRDNMDICIPQYEVEIPGYHKRISSIADCAIDHVSIWVEGYTAAISLRQGFVEPDVKEMHLSLAGKFAREVLHNNLDNETETLARAILALTVAVDES